MLSQIIYTRCSPHRSLFNGGEVLRKEGFGVYSISRELLNTPADLSQIEQRLVTPNASNELQPTLGLFHSYEYSLLPSGQQMISFEYARAYCRDLRKNGASNRHATFIKQGLIGMLDGYPCQWFGASCWNAWKTPENDYYLDDVDKSAVPAFLSCVSSAPSGGTPSRQRARNFIQADHRESILKACVAFLLDEFCKPVSERRVLLIRDLPEHVEQWVSAIQFCFPKAMARELTFSTNKTKLIGQTTSVLFHHSNSADLNQPIALHQTAASSIRQPYCMIVGYHPADNFSNIPLKETKDYVILDGENDQLYFTPSQPLAGVFFDAVARLDERLEHFFTPTVANQSLSSVASFLPALYQSLVNAHLPQPSLRYSSLLQDFTLFNRIDWTSDPSTCNRIIRYGITALECQHEFFVDEITQNHALLRAIYSMCKYVNSSDTQKQFDSLIEGELRSALDTLDSPQSQFFDLWFSLKETQEFSIPMEHALDYLLQEKRIQTYKNQLSSISLDNVEALLSLYLWWHHQKQLPSSYLIQQEQRFSFLSHCLFCLFQQPERLSPYFAQLSRAPDLCCLLVSHVISRLDDQQISNWYQFVFQNSDLNTEKLFYYMLNDPNTCSTEPETLLSYFLQDPDLDLAYTDRLYNALVASQKATAQTGLIYYQAQISLFSHTQLLPVVRKMQSASAFVQWQLFHSIDSHLEVDISKKNYPFYYEMHCWSETLKLNKTSNATLALFFYDCINSKNEEELYWALYHFIEKRYSVIPKQVSRHYLTPIFQKSAKYYNKELHLLTLCALEGTQQDYFYAVSEYVSTSLIPKRKRVLLWELEFRRNQAKMLLSLQAALSLPAAEVNIPKTRVNRAKEALQKAIYNKIGGSHDRRLIQLIKKESQKSPDPNSSKTAEDLISIITE